MLEINDFLDVGKSSPVVDDVIEVGIVLFERYVVHDELPIACRECLGGDGVVVSVLLGLLVVFCRCCFLEH